MEEIGITEISSKKQQKTKRWLIAYISNYRRKWNMAGNFIDGFSQTIEDQRISVICTFFHNIGKILRCNFK